MIHLLVAYRRSTQQLVEATEFDDAQLGSAIDKRIALEAAHWGDPDFEVVILSGHSMDSIRRTHGRYFLTGVELADRMEQSTHQMGRHRNRVPA